MGGCLEDIKSSDKEFNKFYFKDKELTNIYHIKEFKHVICLDCFNDINFKE